MKTKLRNNFLIPYGFKHDDDYVSVIYLYVFLYNFSWILETEKLQVTVLCAASYL